MKKLTTILLSGITAIVLSACGSSSSSQGSLAEVEINDLYLGYSISGTYSSGDPATFEYCNNVVTKIATGTQEGTFDLVDDVVNMYFDNFERYLDPEFNGDVYVLTLDGSYDTYDNGLGLFTITDISTIPCEVLP